LPLQVRRKNRVPIDMDKLRTGIIGVGGYGKAVLTELGKNSTFQIKAIADQNLELAQECARIYEAQAYDDYRSLIVQEKLDVLFLTLPTFLCGECLQLAAKGGIHVFKEAPLARSLPEAAHWVKLMNKARCKFYIGAQKRFAPGYLEAHQLLEQKTIGKVYLARAQSFKRYQGRFDWRGDPVLAGGGMLLEMAYHMVDQIVWNLGVPEMLYSLNSNFCSKRVLPPYRTEDTVVLTMSFSDGTMGNLVSSWVAAPENERLLLHGTEGNLEVSANMMNVFDMDGLLIRQEKYQVDQSWLIAQQIRHFAGSLLDDQIKPVSTAEEHLANVAIIESAYLSARTQLPETLKVYGSVFEIE